MNDPFEAAGFVPVGAAPAPAQNRGGGLNVQRLPPAPRDPGVIATERERLNLARAANARADAAERRAREEFEWKKRNPGGKPGAGAAADGLTPMARSKVKGQLKALDLVEAQLNRVDQLYGKHLKGVGLQSFSEYLPTPANRAFEKAANGILPLVRQALSTSAKDGDSDKELAVWQNLIPSHRAMDAENEENIATLRRLIKQNREATAKMLGEQPAAPAAKAEQGGWKVRRIK